MAAAIIQIKETRQAQALTYLKGENTQAEMARTFYLDRPVRHTPLC